MSNFHLEVFNISRGKGHSIAKRVNYISGERTRDILSGTTHYHKRNDVSFFAVFQQSDAPLDYYDLQGLCNNLEMAEKRYDARTGREFIGSLPNELPLKEQISIVKKFVRENFIRYGLCAIAAIHEGKNIKEPSQDNPHVHIIVSTRTVDCNGFSKKKDREHNKREYVEIWREQWALVQNQAYARNVLDARVSHKSLEEQGIYDRKPQNHLSRIDWQKEKRGEQTRAGDKRRKIVKYNKEQERGRNERKRFHVRSR